jgi:hypothetical protein
MLAPVKLLDLLWKPDQCSKVIGTGAAARAGRAAGAAAPAGGPAAGPADRA